MASVGTIYATRQLVSATALKLYVCALALFGIARLVWVSRVWENLADVVVGGAAQFFLAAVMNTDTLVQMALLVLVLAGVSLVRDLVRSASNSSSLAF